MDLESDRQGRGRLEIPYLRGGQSKGILLNHVMFDLLIPRCHRVRIANADPVAVRAARIDVRAYLETKRQPRVAGHHVTLSGETAT